jgi:hypothetical protein
MQHLPNVFDDENQISTHNEANMLIPCIPPNLIFSRGEQPVDSLDDVLDIDPLVASKLPYPMVADPVYTVDDLLTIDPLIEINLHQPLVDDSNPMGETYATCNPLTDLSETNSSQQLANIITTPTLASHISLFHENTSPYSGYKGQKPIFEQRLYEITHGPATASRMGKYLTDCYSRSEEGQHWLRDSWKTPDWYGHVSIIYQQQHNLSSISEVAVADTQPWAPINF